VPRYKVRFTADAQADLERLFAFLADRGPAATARALAAIRRSFKLLQFSPWSCRKAARELPRHRELQGQVPFLTSGQLRNHCSERNGLYGVLSACINRC